MIRRARDNARAGLPVQKVVKFGGHGFRAASLLLAP
jgi:hypothetical protein